MNKGNQVSNLTETFSSNAAGASVKTEAKPTGIRIDGFVVLVALIGLGLLGTLIYLETAPFLVGLFFLGGLLGVALYHGAFGFTAGWRNLIVKKESAGLRAQLILIALASLLMIPVLGSGQPGMVGAVAPVGLSLIVGSFLFGLGMQLGGGCGSGTLFTVGAGNLRMTVTLIFFIIGSLVGTFHLPWWLDRPGTDPISLISGLGVTGALIVQGVALLAVYLWIRKVEQKSHGHVSHADIQFKPGEKGWGATLLTGRWPFMWAVLVLAVGNLLTLLISGSPWSITFAFGLWGAKVAQAFGMDLSQYEFWTWDFPAQALRDSVLVNVTSVMNFGLLLGAMLAAGLANNFNATGKNPPQLKPFLAAIIGGLLMGYGARLGFGCNVGAFFSGIASASLHGWIWFASAFLGSIIGVKLRPKFGLPD